MASIQKYETKTGAIKYRVRWRIGGELRSQSFDRWKPANDFKIKLEHDLRSGAYIDVIDMTVSQYLDEWLKARKSKLAYNTHESYRFTIAHIRKHIGDIALQKLHPGHVETMCDNLQGTIYLRGNPPKEHIISQRYVKYIFDVLNISLNYAVRHRKVQANPCLSAMPPQPAERREKSIIEPADISVYLKLFADSWAYPAIAISIICGLRRGELCGLKWQDIDFDNKLINVNRSIYVDGKTLKEKPPKNGKPYITYMPDSLCELLKRHRTKQRKNRLLLGLEYQDSDYVITEDNGARPRPDYLYTFFIRRIKSSGLPYQTIHNLRHTSASLMNYEKIDMKTIASMQGRKSIDVTANTYVHAIDEAKRRAADALDKYLL